MAATLACAIATFLLVIPSNLFPLIRGELFGMATENVILVGIGKLWTNSSRGLPNSRFDP